MLLKSRPTFYSGPSWRGWPSEKTAGICGPPSQAGEIRVLVRIFNCDPRNLQGRGKSQRFCRLPQAWFRNRVAIWDEPSNFLRHVNLSPAVGIVALANSCAAKGMRPFLGVRSSGREWATKFPKNNLDCLSIWSILAQIRDWLGAHLGHSGDT